MDSPPPQHDLRLPVMPNVQKPRLPTALLGLLSYVSVLFLVPFFTSQPGSFERFHATQGGVLFAAATFGMLLGGALPPSIGSVVFGAVVVAELLLAIIGTRAILLGEREPLPVLGRLAGRFTSPH